VVGLQRTIGNRATTRLLQRNGPKGGSGGATKRTIVLDGSVFDQINRGNKAVADKLKELLATEDVYMSHAAYEEAVTNRAIPRLGAATKLAVDELHIKVTPPAKPDVLADVRARNAVGSNKTVISQEDVLVAADAKSVGGEVFSPDGVFRENAGGVRKTVGVAVAPESERLAPMGAGSGNKPPAQDYRVGRKLLGLPEVEISLNGSVTPPKTPGGGGGGGGAPKGEPHVTGTGGTVTQESGKVGVRGGAGAWAAPRA
jgi:hypothetical protein